MYRMELICSMIPSPSLKHFHFHPSITSLEFLTVLSFGVSVLKKPLITVKFESDSTWTRSTSGQPIL